MPFQQLLHPTYPVQVLMALRDWFRREIIDDDPWDTNTLIPIPDKGTTAGNPNSNRVEPS